MRQELGQPEFLLSDRLSSLSVVSACQSLLLSLSWQRAQHDSGMKALCSTGVVTLLWTCLCMHHMALFVRHAYQHDYNCNNFQSCESLQRQAVTRHSFIIMHHGVFPCLRYIYLFCITLSLIFPDLHLAL